MNRIFRYTILYLLIFLVVIGIFGTFNRGANPSKELTYGEFINALENGKVKSLSIQPDAGVFVVEGQLKGDEDQTFTVNLPQNNPALMEKIDKVVDEAVQNNPDIVFCQPLKQVDGCNSLPELSHSSSLSFYSSSS